MINPIYKFEITSVYGQTVDNKTVYPTYKSDLAVDWQIEQNEQYYRGKLSGKLNFIGDDFDFINSKNFETEFELRILISYNAGASWTQYWTGKFYKTDCEFDVDDKKITVTPTVFDEYNDVVAGLEKEYNLIDLAPEIQHIRLDKRPMIQVYVPGQSVIACFLSGMYWEQDCTPETDEDKLKELGDGKLNFALCSAIRKCVVSGDITPDATRIYYGAYSQHNEQFSYSNGAYAFSHRIISVPDVGIRHDFIIQRNYDNVDLWQYSTFDTPPDNFTATLTPISGTGATGNATVDIAIKKVYARYVLDTETLGNLNTYLLPADDIVGNNRNYHRCIGYAISDVIYYSTIFSITPTKYGIFKPGQYYNPPANIFIPTFFPVARSAWDEMSIWFSFSAIDWIVEEQGRKAYTLKDAYPLSSAISVLLGQIATGVKHEPTTDYSQFLYSNYNPLSGNAFTLFITQKSNILAGDYDQPAQKAPATLKMITDMLRDCFRCYWFIDKAENGDLRFRIEHISWFLNGGSYSGTPVVGTDLTQMQVTRNSKKWAFATSKYEYNKPQMPERYQFGWMDDVTELFDGYPIDIQSKFVQPGNIEEINVANFTSDIDYMLLNPGACSEDGFALLGAIQNKSTATSIAGQELEQFAFSVIAGQQIQITTPSGAAYGCGVRIKQGSTIVQRITKYFAGTYNETIRLTGELYLYVDARNVRNVTISVISQDFNLPYINFRIDNADHYLQNAFMAFYYLQLFYMWDMPAERIQAKNASGPYVMGIKKQKTQQLQYPVYADPNLYQLVKTNMGNGQIEKTLINLSSRMAKTTLRYDTE